MGLTKQSESNTIYLAIKHYSLWRAVKTQQEGCEAVETTNPRTGAKVTSYGYKFREVSGRAVKLVKYDSGTKYQTRFFGFKLHLIDAGQTFVVDFPYASQALRRLLRVARNIDFSKPFSLTVFKGKSKEGKPGSEETAIWFQQNGESVKAYYSKEQSHGMPEAKYDDIERKWDFREQHRWLVERLQSETIPDIEHAAAKVAPPVEPETHNEEPPLDDTEGPPNEFGEEIPF